MQIRRTICRVNNRILLPNPPKEVNPTNPNSKAVINNNDHIKVKNIEFIYETPSSEIQESQINALVQLFNVLLEKSA